MEEHLPAVVASGFVLVFLADVIGNHINFSSRVYNAAVTSIIWGILFVILDFGYANFDPPPLVSYENLWVWTVVGVLLAFVSDLIGNTIAFERRFVNSFVTAIVWAVAFFIVAKLYLAYAY